MGDSRITFLATAFALALVSCNDEGDERPGVAEIRARGLVCEVAADGSQAGVQMIFPAGQGGPVLESRYRTSDGVLGEEHWRPIRTRYRTDRDVLLVSEPVRIQFVTSVWSTRDGIVVHFLTPSTPLSAPCVVPDQELSVPDGVGGRTNDTKP